MAASRLRVSVQVLCLAVAAGLFAQGCGSDRYELSPDESALMSRLGVVFDPALEGTKAKKLAAGDLLHLSRIQFDPDRASIKPLDARQRYYARIFPRGPLSFVGQRIGVFLSSGTNAYGLLAEASSRAGARLAEEEEQVYIKASNVGVPLWWSSELYRERNGTGLALDLAGRRIPIASSRVGVIQLGEVYADGMTEIDRAATLVHEARHSDCVGGLTREDLRKIANGQLPSNLGCGNLHAICPKGHPYAGLAACDSVAWGAYAVEAILLTRIAVACANCSEEERQIALFMTSDRYSRLLQEEDLLMGRLGDPDLTSLGMIGD